MHLLANITVGQKILLYQKKLKVIQLPIFTASILRRVQLKVRQLIIRKNVCTLLTESNKIIVQKRHIINCRFCYSIGNYNIEALGGLVFLLLNDDYL